MTTGVERVLEVFDEETDVNVLDLDEAIDFTTNVINELEVRLDGMRDDRRNRT